MQAPVSDAFSHHFEDVFVCGYLGLPIPSFVASCVFGCVFVNTLQVLKPAASRDVALFRQIFATKFVGHQDAENLVTC